MRFLNTVCFFIVMAPFMAIGLFVHFVQLGYEMVGPFFVKIMLPAELRKALKAGVTPVVVSRQEVEEWITGYMEKNPGVSMEDAFKAYIKHKQGGSNV